MDISMYVYSHAYINTYLYRVCINMIHLEYILNEL